VTFLKLAKMRDRSERWALLPRLLEVYRAVLASLAEAGAEWVQIDEPVLVSDLDDAARAALKAAYAVLADAPIKIMLATYFGAVDDNLPTLASLPVQGVHIDWCARPRNWTQFAKPCPATR
jgi:5-methyltetrahydropteroyltriglutamate--homocysteine methyltransferase